MAKPTNMNGDSSGKGGNFQSKPNPFADGAPATPAPPLAGNPALGAAIDNVTDAGCAIMLGKTRDAGAWVITVLDGETRHRTYCSNAGEIERALLALHNMYGK